MFTNTKRRKIAPVEELTFDSTAREAYLTGFHKRKQARIKHAQDIAAVRTREEKIKERREMREKRQKELEEHVQAVNSMLRDTDGIAESEEWEGVTAEEKRHGIEDPIDISRVDEYVDEDKYATVTVEAVDVSRDGLRATEDDEVSDVSEGDRAKMKDSSNGDRRHQNKVSPKEKSSLGKPKKKRHKFRYESVAERKATRQKQKLRNAKAAKARRG